MTVEYRKVLHVEVVVHSHGIADRGSHEGLYRKFENAVNALGQGGLTVNADKRSIDAVIHYIHSIASAVTHVITCAGRDHVPDKNRVHIV